MTAASINSSTPTLLNHVVSQEMASSLGITNWTSNTTYDTPQSLIDQLEDYREPGSVLFSAEQAWYRPYPTTLTIILLLHVLWFLQWNQRRSKKQVWASYQQLIVKKQWYRAWCAILSHPPPLDSAHSRDGNTAGTPTNSLSIEFGTAASAVEGGNPWLRIARTALKPFTSGPLSGLPLLVYNCHLLWTCRALEPLFASSWHYLRSLFALSILSLAMELAGRHSLAKRTAHVAGRANVIIDYTSIQPGFGPDPIVRIRKMALHQPMGTCTSLLFSVLFLYHVMFPYGLLQVLPILPTPSFLVPPWLSYLLCTSLLAALSNWRVPCFVFGTIAGCMWILGFHFLGKAYWSCWLLLWSGVATLLSLKHKHPNMTPGVDYVSWNVTGIVHDSEGVPVITSFDGPSDADESITDVDEWDYEGNGSFHGSNDGDNSIIDAENPIRGRLPTVNMDDDEPLLSSHSNHSGRLVRRNGTAP